MSHETDDLTGNRNRLQPIEPRAMRLGHKHFQNFVHPGVVIGRQQLAFVRSKIQAKQHPWYEAYQSLASNRFGDINRSFHPRSVVECGFFNKPDYGCRYEQDDALTAYAMALLWYVSGEKKYADRSIAIMNGWAKAITAHTNKNAPLQAGWAGASWANAADIIRYSNAGWRNDDIQRFKKMLREVYLSLVIKGSNNNGNWELRMRPVYPDYKKSSSKPERQKWMASLLDKGVY